MHVAHVSRSPVAGVPNNLARALNKYSKKYTGRWVPITNVDEQTHYELGRADIVHWHNWVHPNLWKRLQNKKHIVHYHSCPTNLDIQHELPSSLKKLVVNHYHAGLRAYEDCHVIRNVVNLDPLWEYEDYVCNLRYGKFIFAFSATTNEFGVWQRKGVEQMYCVINRVKKHFESKIKIKLDLITNTPYRDCIFRKSSADVVLDECVTPSYHLTSLEGLALGRPTVCWTDERSQDVLFRTTGATTNPFLGTYVGWLEDYLIDMIERGESYLLKKGEDSREWFNKHWNSRDIVRDYESVYDSL